MSGDTLSKKERFLELLDRGSVFVYLDPRREGVKVPSWLATKPQLVLQIGLNFAIPIPDLEVDDDGVRCTLSFNRSPFHCDLPWSAVFAFRDDLDKITYWQADMPAELVNEPAAVRRESPGSRAERRAAKEAPRKPTFKLVSDTTARPAPASVPAPAPAPAAARAEEVDGADGEEVESRPSQPPKAPRERPPWLRVVK